MRCRESSSQWNKRKYEESDQGSKDHEKRIEGSESQQGEAAAPNGTAADMTGKVKGGTL